MQIYDKPIPLNVDINGWDLIPIVECTEPLVLLDEINPARILITSEYFNQNIIGAIERCYLRETAANLLSTAADELPHGWKLVIYDGWRPLTVQKSIFDEYYMRLKQQFPSKKHSEVLALTKRYVSLPSDNPLKPSPHNTGGAIDLSIRDSTGTDLDMGSFFDDFSDCAFTSHFEFDLQEANISSESHIKLINRRILYNLMTSVGFTNYPEEWWHFDYGNQFWAKLTNQSAIFGATSP